MKNLNRLFFTLALISSSSLFTMGIVDDALTTAGNITEDAVVGAGNIVQDVLPPYDRPYYRDRVYYETEPVYDTFETETVDRYYGPTVDGFEGGLYYNLALDDEELDDIDDATADDADGIIDEEEIEVDDIQ